MGIFSLYTIKTHAQTPELYYLDAYSKIVSILASQNSTDSPKTVFLIENTCFENQLEYAVKFQPPDALSGMKRTVTYREPNRDMNYFPWDGAGYRRKAISSPIR
jgi:hypothetical protein